MTEEQYRRAVAYQRDLGLSEVRVMLDFLCQMVGLNYGEWRYYPDSVVIL